MPYQNGVELRIRGHVPPEPFFGGYGECPRSHVGLDHDSDYKYPEDVDRIEFALDHPPLETEPPAEEEEYTFTITGTKTVRRFDVEDGGGPHVVTGYLDGDESAVYVAKIYDGVDFPLIERDDDIDCMTLADADYATEAWAYETLQPVKEVSRLLPSYYGAWTFALETGRPRPQRWVRMILLQLLPGETVLDKIRRATSDDGVVQQARLPDLETRLRVLRDTFEAERSVCWDGEVLHTDVTPRNVMVSPDGRVVLFDFNRAVVYPFHYRPHWKHDDGADPLPKSPIEHYWPYSPGAGTFAYPWSPWVGWVPPSWVENRELAAEWLLETWKNPPPGKYRPLSDYFLNNVAHAERSKKLQAALEKLGRKQA